MNNNFIQLSGPFEVGVNVLQDLGFTQFKQFGIQCKRAHKMLINDKEFEMGKTEILEFDTVNITSLIFQQHEPTSTIIDLLI